MRCASADDRETSDALCLSLDSRRLTGRPDARTAAGRGRLSTDAPPSGEACLSGRVDG